MPADPRSPTDPRPAASAPTRKRFALTGPSRRLDPLTHAVRRDLADVRLADQVFAPHYAAPLPRVLARPASLETGVEVVELAPGDAFEVLEIAGGKAWGMAPAQRVVGYLDADALASA